MSRANLKSEPRTIVLSNAALQLIAVAQARRWSDKRGFHLISDVLPFGAVVCWIEWGRQCLDHAEHYSRSHDAVIRVYDAAGKVIETHEHKGEFERAAKRRVVMNSHATTP